MGRFQPFSLAKSIQAGQQIRANRMKMDAYQAESDRKKNLRQIAQESTKPTYEEFEAETFPGEDPIKGLGTQTGTEYDPQAHVKGLQAAGEVEAAAGLQRHLGQMDEVERDKVKFDATQALVDVRRASTPELWEALQDKVEAAGGNRRTWGERPDVEKEALAIVNIYDENFGRGGKGTSEFERLESLKQSGEATQSELQRHGILKGTIGREPTKGTQKRFEDRLNFDINKQEHVATKDQRKATTTYRKEAASDVKELRAMELAADKGLRAAEVGGALESKTVKIMLSQIAGSKVKALAQLQEFKNYGNLAQRAVGLVTDWVSGGYSAEQLSMAKQIFTEMRDNIAIPGIEKSDNFYRTLAKNSGLNPHEVAPFVSGEDVRDAMESGILTYKQAKTIMNDNPNWIKRDKRKSK